MGSCMLPPSRGVAWVRIMRSFSVAVAVHGVNASQVVSGLRPARAQYCLQSLVLLLSEMALRACYFRLIATTAAGTSAAPAR